MFVIGDDIVHAVNSQATTAVSDDHTRGWIWLCAKYWRSNAVAFRSWLGNVCFEFAVLEFRNLRCADGLDEELALNNRCHKSISVKCRTRLKDMTYANL